MPRSGAMAARRPARSPSWRLRLRSAHPRRRLTTQMRIIIVCLSVASQPGVPPATRTQPLRCMAAARFALRPHFDDRPAAPRDRAARYAGITGAIVFHAVADPRASESRAGPPRACARFADHGQRDPAAATRNAAPAAEAARCSAARAQCDAPAHRRRLASRRLW